MQDIILCLKVNAVLVDIFNIAAIFLIEKRFIIQSIAFSIRLYVK